MDPHLNPLLYRCSNRDLEPLVTIITGKGRVLGIPTEALSRAPAYRAHFPDHKKYIDEIEREIRLYGGHTFLNACRGEGAPYARIVCEVAKKIGVERPGDAETVDELERRIIVKIVGDNFENLDAADKEAIIKTCVRRGTLDVHEAKDIAENSWKLSGFAIAKIHSMHSLYDLAFIASRAVFRPLGLTATPAYKLGLTKVVGGVLGRKAVALASPLSAAASAAWVLHYMASPAYRITVPFVVHVAYLRQKAAQKPLLGRAPGARGIAKFLSFERVASAR